MTLGNTTWQLHDVYFDSPDPNGSGTYIVDDCVLGDPGCANVGLKLGGTRSPKVLSGTYTIPRDPRCQPHRETDAAPRDRRPPRSNPGAGRELPDHAAPQPARRQILLRAQGLGGPEHRRQPPRRPLGTRDPSTRQATHGEAEDRPAQRHPPQLLHRGERGCQTRKRGARSLLRARHLTLGSARLLIAFCPSAGWAIAMATEELAGGVQASRRMQSPRPWAARLLPGIVEQRD